MINLIWWKFDPHSSYEYDWINLLLSDFEVNHIVDLESNVCVDNAIIVSNLSQMFFEDHESGQKYCRDRQQFFDYVRRFKDAGMKVGLFHLGDEFYKESTEFYQDLNFVFRQYYKEGDHKRYQNCHYLPLGYKSGFRHELVDKPIHQRDYLWSFAGQMKGSRYEMMKYAKGIPGGKYHTTTQWNDPNGLQTKEYAALLNNTKFSLCPMGNNSVDCFRVYESLEAGAIPIIAAQDIRQALAVLVNPQLLMRYGRRDRSFWLRNYRYWEKAFESNFPCPLIYNWRDLESLLSSIDVERLSENIQLWWADYKQSFIQEMRLTIKDAFF